MTLVDMKFILLAGADALDWHNPCATCGAYEAMPCTDGLGNKRDDICPDRVPGDPMLASTLRRMADAAAHRYHMLTGRRI